MACGFYYSKVQLAVKRKHMCGGRHATSQIHVYKFTHPWGRGCSINCDFTSSFFKENRNRVFKQGDGAADDIRVQFCSQFSGETESESAVSTQPIVRCCHRVNIHWDVAPTVE